MRWFPALLLAVGCFPSAPAGDDLDQDGSPDVEDCAPSDRLTFPGAEDDYGDGLDRDCDGGDGVDRDGDGYPSNVVGILPYLDLLDCDDLDPQTHPGATDPGGDGIDQNCNGIDGIDADGDGVPSVESGGTDCDDTRPETWPGAPDPVGGGDSNCDGIDGVDADHDGVPSPESGGTDCDDGDPAVFPGAWDPCDGVDTNCLAHPDEVDADQDGWLVCEGDCADTDGSRHPGAAELCDAVDQDCDGSGGATDGDGDGVQNCAGDCDDGDASVHPGQSELCDGLDQDCDGAPGPSEVDADGDGFAACGQDCDDNNASRFPGNWNDGAADGDRDCDGNEGAGGLGAAPTVLLSEFAGNRLGYSVAFAGDVDGDGLDDVLVGSPGSNQAGTGLYPQGRVLVYRGADLRSAWSDGELSADEAHCDLRGESAYDQAGFSVSEGGDLDQDGLDDFVVGAYGSDSAAQNAGKVYVVRGATLLVPGIRTLGAQEWIWTGEGLDHQAGYAVAGGHDVNGDGVPDLLIGANGHTAQGVWAGAAYLLTQPGIGGPGVPRSLALANHRWTGAGEGHFAGQAVAMGGDIDGDGRSEIAIGAPFATGMADGSGVVYVIAGANLGAAQGTLVGNAWARLLGEGASGHEGSTLAFATDIDGDLRGDLLVGTPSPAGRVRIVAASQLTGGAFNLPGARHHVLGGGTDGASHPAASDLDGDGRDEVIVGASGAGSVRVWRATALGPPGGSLTAGSATWSFAGNGVPGAGAAVGGGGDVDGDGLDDLIVGSDVPPAGTVPGRAWWLSGL